MSDKRVPISQAFGGLSIHPLLEGEVPLEAFLLIKLLDSDGNPQWSFRSTNQLNLEELLGAMTVQVELLKRRLVAEWDDDESDEE